MKPIKNKPECATLSVEKAAKRLGIGRASAFRAIERGEIPSIRIGKRILVPIARLEALLRGEVNP